ncbi:cytochrome P450 6a9 [Stomoxys calcitrans]|uniref:Cytochrome P450 n=1 Tax=Stomoxys calcitrans TaxID=35570 RepID=A0A1I8PV85_STOCA|nr:cytochrome P450 6a9 [Stomoxys calcitrans]
MLVTTVLLTVLLALFGYVIHSLRQHYSYWKNLNIAHDRPHWLMGNFDGSTIHKSVAQCVQDLYDKYRHTGPFVGMYWFTKISVLVVEPSLMKHILIKDFSKFTDRGMFNNPKDDPLTGTLFNLDGHKWRSMRNKLSPTFTSGKMKIMFPLVNQIGQELVKVLDKSLDNSDIIEVWDLMARFASDVIGSCAFGIETSSLKNPKSEFRIMGRRALTEHRLGILGVGFRLNFPEVARKLHMKETIPEVEDYFLGLAREAVDYREKNNIKRNDFMDMLLELKNNKLMKSESGEEFTNLSFGEIAAQAFVFLVAGFETSSTTMAFIMYELARNEEIQAKARAEVLEVLQKHNQEFTYECMKEMMYLEQILNETLRLHSVIPFLHRQALEDFVVPGHPNYVIKKGMYAIMPTSAIHHDERYYPQPHTFNPDNFSHEKVAERDSVLHMPFGDGPRNCIGLRFGKMQVIVGMALLLKNFKFSICDETPIPMKYSIKGILTCPETGIPLKVVKI